MQFMTEKRITILTVSIALFMDVLDSNVINTAIPSMARSLQVNPIDLKIALISYLLSLAVFIPASGWTADKYGTKHVFIAAIGLFTVSSFWCGYAHTLTALVIARCFQGMGGAFMLSLGRLIIVRTFKQQALVEAMNSVIIVVSVAVMIGPYIGGIISDHLSWPWIFWLNIPVGILLILLAAYGLGDPAQRRIRPFDKLGFILFGGGLAIFCFALSQLSDTRANVRIELLAALLGVMMITTFFMYAARTPYPIINTTLFRIRTFKISIIGNLCSRLGFGGVPFLLPLLLQISFGFSAELSGLLLVPIAFGIITAKLVALRLLRYFGYKRFLLGNTIFVALLLWMFQLIDVHTPVYAIACMTFVFGLGTAMQFTALNSLAYADIYEDELSSATSIASTTQQIAQSFGVAVAAILLRLFSIHLSSSLTLTSDVFHDAFFSLGILTFVAGFLFLWLKNDDGKQMFVTRDE